MDRARDINEDLAEIAALALQSPRLRRHLDQHGEDLRKELAMLQSTGQLEPDAPTPSLAAPAAAEPDPAQAPGPASAEPAGAAPAPVRTKPSGAAVKWTSLKTYGWDQDGYSGKWVHVYVTVPGMGAAAAAERVSCAFGKSSFDLTVRDVDGQNLRLLRDNLSKEVDAAKSKFKVKGDRVTLSLRKVDGAYGADHWTELTSKKKKEVTASTSAAKADDPSAGIMDMMKELYDNGDDEMRKTIGEAMLKSKNPGAMGAMDDMNMDL